MPWPPPLPSTTDVINTTPMLNKHPGDHNLIADALAEMVASPGRLNNISVTLAGTVTGSVVTLGSLTVPAAPFDRLVTVTAIVATGTNNSGHYYQFNLCEGSDATRHQSIRACAGGPCRFLRWFALPANTSRTYLITAQRILGTLDDGVAPDGQYNRIEVLLQPS